MSPGVRGDGYAGNPFKAYVKSFIVDCVQEEEGQHKTQPLNR